jgi:hypothetical protein
MAALLAYETLLEVGELGFVWPFVRNQLPQARRPDLPEFLDHQRGTMHPPAFSLSLCA